nr:MAG TPA: hypothetical protein [Microviridae sp.]
MYCLQIIYAQVNCLLIVRIIMRDCFESCSIF